MSTTRSPAHGRSPPIVRESRADCVPTDREPHSCVPDTSRPTTRARPPTGALFRAERPPHWLHRCFGVASVRGPGTDGRGADANHAPASVDYRVILRRYGTRLHPVVILVAGATCNNCGLPVIIRSESGAPWLE